MKYYKKEWERLEIVTAIRFNGRHTITVDLSGLTSRIECQVLKDDSWMLDHFSEKNGYSEIEKGEFLLIMSKAIEEINKQL